METQVKLCAGRRPHFLLGFVGPKAEAQDIQQQLATFLRQELNQELSEDKTLITHAHTESAHFLGYEIHTLHADDKHDHRGQRCINGSIGLRVPVEVLRNQGARYIKRGKPIHRMERVNDSAYSIVAQYQAEYAGLVQYYRLAYNLHRLGQLKWVMETSLVKTLAKKFKVSCPEIYRRYRALHTTKEGTYKVIRVTVERENDKPPLETHFGGIPLRWNKWVTIHDDVQPIWSGRSEVVERLLAETCELCRATEQIEVHHIRKLADLHERNRSDKRPWVQVMAARRRKTLVVCRKCHEAIHAGHYDGPAVSK